MSLIIDRDTSTRREAPPRSRRPVPVTWETSNLLPTAEAYAAVAKLNLALVEFRQLQVDKSLDVGRAGAVLCVDDYAVATCHGIIKADVRWRYEDRSLGEPGYDLVIRPEQGDFSSLAVSLEEASEFGCPDPFLAAAERIGAAIDRVVPLFTETLVCPVGPKGHVAGHLTAAALVHPEIFEGNPFLCISCSGLVKPSFLL